MKYRLLWLPLALAACSQSPSSGPSPSASTATPAPSPPAATSAPAPGKTMASNDSAELGQYIWQLSDATDSAGKRIDALFARLDKPVELRFNANRLNIANSCNSMNARFSVANGRMQLDPMMTTMMACPDPALAALDGALGERIRGSVKYTLNTQGSAPQLQLVTDGGDTLTFTGKSTPETRYGGPGETAFLEISAQTVPCNNPVMPDKQCLQVRERHYDEHGIQTGTPSEWKPLNQDIEGYAHEPGVRNVLRVKRYALKNPPADAPNTAYVLDMIVETEKVQQ